MEIWVLIQIQNYCQHRNILFEQKEEEKRFFEKTIFDKEKMDEFNSERKDTKNKIFILLLFQF